MSTSPRRVRSWRGTASRRATYGRSVPPPTGRRACSSRSSLRPCVPGTLSAAKPGVLRGAEARGFILGAAIARELGCGFVPARRPGKLPPETVGATYALEYGKNTLELHPETIRKGDRVLIHDDVLATGGTVEAIAGLVEGLGAEVVGVAFIIELTFLGGRERLEKYDFHALIAY